MEKLGVRIRGIYSTALTSIFKEAGLVIVEPSEKITRRFNLKEEDPPSSLLKVRDRRDKQGVIVEGDRAREAIGILREGLFDLIVREKEGVWEVEFPYLSKLKLDSIRSKVLPTIGNHHRLRIIAGSEVDWVEEGPMKGSELEDLIYSDYQPGVELGIEHIKIGGQRLFLGRGRIIEFNPSDKTLKLLRRFKGGGTYDGLDLPIDEDDFCITLTKEAFFGLIHTYYSKKKELKGRLYNFNTPVEFYPSSIRYVDLELDIVETKDGSKRLIDEEIFEELVNKGHIGSALSDKIRELSFRVMND
ncbi:TPA: hypothetical protein DCX15_05125 [bacterium]|nr:hypothetical protein [bacterium]